MRMLIHPALEDITVEGIMYALSDPVRVAIYKEIAGTECSKSCSGFQSVKQMDIPKSTLSMHFKVLRESGLIRSERRGVEMMNSPRCMEINQRFPGLLEAIVRAHQIQTEATQPHRRSIHQGA